MSKFGEEICKEAEEKVLLRNIRSLMNTMELTAEQAMDALKVPDYDKEKYTARLSGNL